MIPPPKRVVRLRNGSGGTLLARKEKKKKSLSIIKKQKKERSVGCFSIQLVCIPALNMGGQSKRETVGAANPWGAGAAFLPG